VLLRIASRPDDLLPAADGDGNVAHVAMTKARRRYGPGSGPRPSPRRRTSGRRSSMGPSDHRWWSEFGGASLTGGKRGDRVEVSAGHPTERNS